MAIKLAVITTHPIQYHAPLFRLLAQESEIELRVFYSNTSNNTSGTFDPGFNKKVSWNIPLLEGYSYQFLNDNYSKADNLFFDSIISSKLIRNIELWGAEIVWVWGWAKFSHLKAIFHFYGKIPVWFRGDSTLLDEPQSFAIKRLARRIWLKWVYGHINKAFYVGSNNKDYFLKHGLKLNQLLFAPHAIDNDRFALEDESIRLSTTDLKEKLALFDSDFVLLFVGKFEHKKNPGFLLQLMANISDPRLKLVLIGSGILENELIEKSKSDFRIKLIGFKNQSELPLYYRLATFSILPSVGPNETWGLVMNEAMSCGIPVLASNKCGGASDLINEKTGFIFDSNPEIGLNQVTTFLNRKLETGIPEFDSNHIKNWVSTNFSYVRIVEAVKNELALLK